MWTTSLSNSMYFINANSYNATGKETLHHYTLQNITEFSITSMQMTWAWRAYAITLIITLNAASLGVSYAFVAL